MLDESTGLYYNYQRDYNPDTGSYLTPDPLGFPDGADPYAYVNNDPLNKVDPLGLYQSDIHYYMTFFLAVAAGVPADDARVIALAAQYVDENDETRPINLNGIDDHRARLLTYHFTAIQDITIDPKTGKVSGKLGSYGDPYTNTVIHCIKRMQLVISNHYQFSKVEVGLVYSFFAKQYNYLR